MSRPRYLERLGVYRVLRALHDGYLRDWLPGKVGVYNVVPVRDRALLDFTDERVEHEEALVSATRQSVQTGDRIVIVGVGKTSR
jgi:hypothetical protein